MNQAKTAANELSRRTRCGLNMLSDTCDGAKGRIEDILQAVAGYPGSSEAVIPHEMKMQNGEGRGY